MTRNPLINGLAASAYIFLIALFMNYGMRTLPGPDTFMIPVMMISLLTFSVSMMGYIFGYQPFVLYFDNKKKEAVKLFLQTVAVFGGLTALVMVLVFSRLLA